MTVTERETETTDQMKVKGAMLVRVRGMTPDERAAEGWQDSPRDIPCVEFDNGAVLYPACEECDKPGTIYGTYAGGRWGVNSTDEPYRRPPAQKMTPRWAYPAVALALLLTALAVAGAFTLLRVNQDQRRQVDQQQQIIQEQRSLMNRQADDQRTIQRLIRTNRADVQKSLEDIKNEVAGVVAERDGLRAANAQLGQSNDQLRKRAGQQGSGRR